MGAGDRSHPAIVPDQKEASPMRGDARGEPMELRPNADVPADSAVEPPAVGLKASPSKAPYAPPTLERLGPWQAFTLQQSIPIFP